MPTAPGYANCSYELKHSALNRSAYLTFGCDPTDTDPATVATKLVTAFSTITSLFSCIDNNVTMVKARVSLGTDSGEDLVGVAAASVAGGRALSSLTPNCAVLVHKQSTRGGRRGRGRMYIPWAAGSSTTSENGSVLAADVTATQQACNTWLAYMANNVGPVVVLHRPSKPGTAHPSTPGAPNVVTSMTVDPIIGTQRRRLGR